MADDILNQSGYGPKARLAIARAGYKGGQEIADLAVTTAEGRGPTTDPQAGVVYDVTEPAVNRTAPGERPNRTFTDALAAETKLRGGLGGPD